MTTKKMAMKKPKMKKPEGESTKPSTESMKPGGGGRFKKMVAQLSKEGNVENPEAVAAAIGRKKYGAKKMSGWAAKSRKKNEK